MSSEPEDEDLEAHNRDLSSPTPEGGSRTGSSPAVQRPEGFEDDFKGAGGLIPTPLYDEDDSEPLVEFPSRFKGEGWTLMIRHPLKKKLMAERFWKPCFVRISGQMLGIFGAKEDSKPLMEILLQTSYSLSEPILQAFDAYGKIHTVKLQHILYKERVGIRAGKLKD